MILKDVLSRVLWHNVWNELSYHYPDQIYAQEGYFRMYLHLIETDPVLQDMYLDIQYVEEEDSEDNYHNVVGIEDGDDTKYALDFMPWNEWLGLKIKEDLLERYSEEAVIAHSLWEMSFYSFDEEEIKNQRNEISDMLEEIENMTEEEIEKAFVEVDLDELFGDNDV